MANVTVPPAITLVSVCKASVQNRVNVVNVSALGGVEGAEGGSKMRGRLGVGGGEGE